MTNYGNKARQFFLPYLLLLFGAWVFTTLVIIFDFRADIPFRVSDLPPILLESFLAALFFTVPGFIAFALIDWLEDRSHMAVVMAAVLMGNIIWGVIGFNGLFDTLKFGMENLRDALVSPVALAGAWTAARYTGRFVKQRSNLKEAQLRAREAETKILMLQLVPHTMFNMLNTAYASVVEDKERGADYLLKMADLMRHLTYGADKEWVPAEAEIDFIATFAALEKPRARGNLSIEINHEGDTDIPVPSMLFVTLFENALKHGWGRDGEIDINLEFKGYEDGFDFRLSNTITDFVPYLKGDDAPGGLRVGLQNVRRRLELLYPGSHHFEAKRQQGHFIVELEVRA